MDNREIDRLVAEKVMSFHIHTYGNVPDWLAYPIRDGEVNWLEPTIIPNYSSDISAAWQVIIKMRQLGWHYELGSTVRDTDTARFGRGNYDHYENKWNEEHWGEGDITTAICLAALEAVGVEVPESGAHR